MMRCLRIMARAAAVGASLGILMSAGCTLFQPDAAVDFEGTPVSGTAPHLVDFTAIVDGTVTAYQWSFGDGETSTEAAPSHIYRAAGLFTVALTVELPDGSVVDAIKEDLIRVATAARKASGIGALYWLDRSTGTISAGYRDGYDSWTVVTGIYEGDSIAVGADKLYWTAERKIERANLDGTGREAIVHEQSNPSGIAVDAQAGKVYWASLPTGIHRANLDGTGAETWASKWECQDTYPWLLAVDPEIGRLIWFEMFYDPGCMILPVSINRPQGYSAPASIHWSGLSSFRDHEIVISLSDSGGIALDVGLSAGARYIYWTNPSANRINRCRLDGSEFAWIVNGTFDPRGIAVDASEGKIYWSGQLGIHRANLNGTEVELIFPDVHADALALDI